VLEDPIYQAPDQRHDLLSLGVQPDSGLRLGDAVTISRDRVENGTLILRTEKTGTLVRLPLPQEVTDAIAACPAPRYPFWSGNGKNGSLWCRTGKEL
jgi:hypothetical protein